MLITNKNSTRRSSGDLSAVIYLFLYCVESGLHALKILCQNGDKASKEGELIEVIVEDMLHLLVFLVDDSNASGI